MYDSDDVSNSECLFKNIENYEIYFKLVEKIKCSDIFDKSFP